MEHHESKHVAQDGATVYWQEWLPDGEPRATMVLIHGLGEHSGRWDHWARRFADEGIAVFSMDNRGHGKTEGTRGDMRMPDAVADVGELVAEARNRYPELPVVIYGHSLGGLITLTYTLENHPDIVAQVASAPALDSELREQKVKFAVANLLGGVAPGIVIPTGLDSEGISRDPAVVAAYNNDPLVHDKGSVGLAKQTFAAMDTMMEQTSFPAPLLIIHGTDDRLTVPEASRTLVDQASGDITLIEYEGMYHEPHNEPEKDDVFADIMNWLNKYL